MYPPIPGSGDFWKNGHGAIFRVEHATFNQCSECSAALVAVSIDDTAPAFLQKLSQSAGALCDVNIHGFRSLAQFSLKLDAALLHLVYFLKQGPVVAHRDQEFGELALTGDEAVDLLLYGFFAGGGLRAPGALRLYFAQYLLEDLLAEDVFNHRL